MGNSTAIATVRAGVIQPKSLDEWMRYCGLLADTDMVPKDFRGKPGSILVAAQMGAELGLSPLQSLQNIAVINGRPSLWGDSLLAIALSRADCEDVIETFDEATTTATCVVKRRGKLPTTGKFSQEDAKRAGLWGKSGPWSQHPRRMMQMRARSFAIRDAYADALRGFQCADEVSEFVEVDSTVVATPAAPAPPTKGNAGLKARLAPTPVAEVVAEVEHDECTGEVVADVAAEMMAFIESASSTEVLRSADWAQAKSLSEDAQADIRIAYSEKMKELQNG